MEESWVKLIVGSLEWGVSGEREWSPWRTGVVSRETGRGVKGERKWRQRKALNAIGMKVSGHRDVDARSS